MDIKVSIIITSFNREKFISKAIKSALSQTYSNIEVIVTDNCSTDKTDEVILEFLSDPRFIYSKNPTNIGMVPNFEKGIYELAKGDFVTFLSSDDYFIDDNFISDAVGLIEKYPNLNLVFCKCGVTTFDDENKILDVVETSLFNKEFYNGKDLFLLLANTLGLGFGGGIMHREAAIKNGIFKNDFQSADFHIVFKLLLQGNCGLINKTGYIWRLHDGNASKKLQIELEFAGLDYIIDIYKFGIENNLLDEKLLKKWRDIKLKRRLKFSLVCLKIKEPQNFNSIYKQFETRYPETVRSLKSDITLQVFLLLSKRKRIVLFFSSIFLNSGELRVIKELYET